MHSIKLKKPFKVVEKVTSNQEKRQSTEGDPWIIQMLELVLRDLKKTE